MFYMREWAGPVGLICEIKKAHGKVEECAIASLPFNRSSLTRWRQGMGEAKLMALIHESLAVATRTEAMKPNELARVVVDTTVQRLVRLAAYVGVELRFSRSV